MAKANLTINIKVRWWVYGIYLPFVAFIYDTKIFFGIDGSKMVGVFVTPDVTKEFKSLGTIGEHLILTSQSVIVAPDFFHKNRYTKSLPGNTGTLIQRGRVLITTYSEPVAC